jgi:hypothetical protein
LLGGLNSLGEFGSLCADRVFASTDLSLFVSNLFLVLRTYCPDQWSCW